MAPAAPEPAAATFDVEVGMADDDEMQSPKLSKLQSQLEPARFVRLKTRFEGCFDTMDQDADGNMDIKNESGGAEELVRAPRPARFGRMLTDQRLRSRVRRPTCCGSKACSRAAGRLTSGARRTAASSPGSSSWRRWCAPGHRDPPSPRPPQLSCRHRRRR